MHNINWKGAYDIYTASYTCGFCGNLVASPLGFVAYAPGGQSPICSLHICPYCACPTFLAGSTQMPRPAFGLAVTELPDKLLASLYNEARICTTMNAHTAAVLCCRKALMHIAVDKGADEGQTFLSYVNYLADRHFIPPDAKCWVDQIREKGNEANHEITVMSEDDAEQMISFLGMLLKFIYEFPAAIGKTRSSKKQTSP